MGRIFFFLLLALAAYMAWQWFKRSGAGSGATARPRVEPPQAMVPCARCGLHLPRADALPADERFFCSEEHRRLGPSA
jgi:uncharacterized protein